MIRILLAALGLIGLLACEGGSFKKKDCQSCSTVTYGKQGRVDSSAQNVCGTDEIAAFTIANTIRNSSLTVVTSCK